MTNKKDSNKAMVIICFIIFGVLLSAIAIPLSFVDYNYQLEKCTDFQSDASSYDFDIKLETNAEYNERCYYLNNHPLAILEYVLLPLVCVIFFFGTMVCLYYMLKPLESRGMY